MNTNSIKQFALIFMISILLISVNSFAQTIKTIPGDFATIEAAIIDLNTNGVPGSGVTFNVAAGHTEIFTSDTSGRFRATGTVSDPILFQKSGGGANPVITAGVGTGTLDGIIIFTGGDYITFDGIDLQENSGNTNSTTQMEWGYALLKRNLSSPADGCQYVTIKNATITLDGTNTNTWGIYAKNHTVASTTSSTLSDSLDILRYCKFYSNTITNSYNGIQLYGSSSMYDENNEMGVDGGNSILNYGGGSSTARGVYTYYQSNLKVANNIVNGGNFSHTTLLYGISTYTANNADINVYGNTITLTQGNNLTYALTNSVGSSGVDNTVNIYNNTIQNCANVATGSYSAWMIYNLASAYNVNIYGNTITNNSRNAGTGPMYCIKQSSSATNVQIYDNEIYNNYANGSIHGIELASGTNLSVYKNKIYDLRTTSTATYLTSGVLVSGSSSGPGNVNIYNNFISDLKAPNSSDDEAIRGINLTSTTSGANIGVYYNTIFLNAVSVGANFGTSGIYQTTSTLFARPTLDMRDNIIVNTSTPNGSGKTVVFRRSAADATLNYYSTLSNNNCFYAGTPSASRVIFFDGTNFDETLADFKLRVTPRETNSVTENVPFVNSTITPYDLHVQTTASTQTDGGATPVTSPIAVTDDYDGDTRDATTPDIGADEFVGMGIDLTPPAIIYTVFDPTTSTSNRTLSNVTITDQSGVNVTPGTAPRIYYKKSTDNNTYIDNTSTTNGWKYTETSNISSPFEFLVDYSLLFGGTGVQMGDVIQYFVVAQDLYTPANVGINSGDFNTPPSSVNLTSVAFPITGTINSYYIISLLSGTVTVGTGGDYTSLTGLNGLFNAFNGNIVTGDVTAEIISDITETGEISLNEWVEQGAGNYILTIQPNSGMLRTISGSYDGGLIRLEGADRVIFDGRFNSSGHSLTIENTLAASNTAAFRFLSLGAAGQGCTDVTIRNCNIKGGANNLSNIFGIFLGSNTGSLSTGNAGGVDFDNISILENNIWNCRNGIFARGTSTIPFADQMQNFVVSGNVIGHDNVAESVTEYGMYLGYADAPQVTFNEVYNMFYDVSKWGIYFTSNVNNAVISKNKIHSIKQPGTTGYNSVGIVFWSSTGCFDNQIDNNMIYDLSTWGNSSMYLVGIRIAGGSGYKVYFNSISINDTLGNTSTNLVSSCLYFSTASTNADVRNNILYNTRTGNSPKNYAVFSPNTTTFTSIDYNDYWTTGSVLGYFGGDIATLNDWKTATGQDANSISDDPHFISPTNLHIDPAFNTVCGLGVYLASLPTDIDGDVRLDPPAIGADECGGTATFAFTVNVTNGWNMVSVPGTNPAGMGVTDWWSGKDPTAGVFKYAGGYVEVFTTAPTEGYWMKNVGAQVYSYTDIQIVTHNSINATLGWNMIGGFENTVPTASLTTTPSGLITTPVFEYSGGYNAATDIVPGYGYWVKMDAAGLINSPPLAKGTEPVEFFPENWGKIILTDATGINYTLYAVKGEVNLDKYELPPMPPAGMFDIRFNSGRIAEDINSSIQSINMSGITYPLTVRVEGMDMRLMDETGRTVNVNLKSGEDVVISDATIQKLMVTGDLIPAEYALEQNYPNPFNPSTVIEFSLPEEVSNVKLSIYNALGERVAELVNSFLTAGKYQYQWNAKNVATGMYIYELRTDKFVSIKKMILIK